ncbi:hypothetical protein [Paraburkholderia dinghuensis]|uniref:DUF429 domain-containing protein n=1 Tax=Paraburkholderia dinghuensis TaxID=2305225 RepID=A0A3N6Q0V3_9BURK|nr:hypothetical protein [Paraburkholderia dinghuensis]RQH05806.1 hypothetical protein D1Y85_14445 [Paraburkholderia dinghuensis]
MSTAFRRYVGIDYSGAQTSDNSLKGLRVYIAPTPNDVSVEALPPPSPRKYWTRRGVALWLADLLSDDVPTIVGIDHSFSFPLRYFEAHQLAPDWYAFLEDFREHWPTDEPNVYVDFVRDGVVGNGQARQGNPRWRRMAEERCRAKSVFHFDVQGSVAKSTHSGIPWLLYLHRQLGDRVHFWPFDGWDIPAGRSAIVEAYPSMWRRGCVAPAGMTDDQYDAYTIAEWLRYADLEERLYLALHPPLSASERAVAQVEGWIVGVGGVQDT